MAKIILSNNETFTVGANSTADVVGGTGAEKLLVTAGSVVTTDQNVERTEFSGASSAYTYAISGNVVTVKSAGVTVATLGAGGTNQVLAFSDGSAALAMTGLGTATLGGAAIPATAAAVVPTTLNTTDKSTVASTTTTTPSAFTITTSAGTLTEAATGTSNMTFTVNLSAAQATATTVNYATSTGTAANSATATSDYTTTNGTVTIPANTLSATFTVPVVGDGVFDGTVSNPTGTEVFTVTLSGASAGSLANTTTTGTITDLQTNALPTQTISATSPNVLLTAQGSIPGIVVADANNNNVTTVLTAQNGLMQTAGSGAIAAAAAARTITLTGSLADVNASLALLKYTSDRTISGTDTITVVTTDPLGGVSTTGTLNVTVNPGGVFTTATTDSLGGSASNDFYLGVATTVGTVTATIDATDKLAAGAGTGDTLTVTGIAATAPTFPNTTAFTGLENLVLTTATGATAVSTIAIDVASRFDTNLTSISITDGSTAKDDTTVALTNVNSGTTVTLNNSLATSADIGMAVATTGTLTLALAGGVTVPSLLAAANPAGTLNIQSNGSTANVITSLTTGVLATTGTINVSGSAPLTLTLAAAGAAPLIVSGANASGILTISNASNTSVSTAISGGSANDILTGSATFANTLNGNAGNDSLTGGTGADTLNGGLGDDTLVGGTGADSMTGGTGKDTYTVDTTADSVFVIPGDTGTVAASTADVINGIVGGVVVNLSAYYTGAAATFIADGNLASATTGASATLRDVYIDSVKKAIVVEMDATGTTTQEIYIGNAAAATVSNVAGVLTFGAVPMTSYISGSTVMVEGQAPAAASWVEATLASSIPQVGNAGTAAFAAAGAMSNVTGAATSFSSIDLSKVTGAAGVNITGSSLGNTITASTTMADNIIGGAGIDTIILGAAGNVDILRYSESGAVNRDVVTGFTVGTDLIGYSIGNIDNNGTNQTLSTMLGGDINGAIAAGGFAAQSVVKNTNLAAADATNLLVFTATDATSFATAIGTATVVDTSNGNTAGLGAAEGVAAVWYDSTNLQNVYGYIVDSIANGTALTSADTFVEVVRVTGAQGTGANGGTLDLSLLAF